MGYSNSSLIDYTLLSQHTYGERTHAIDTITIHCVVGQCTVESLGAWFRTSRKASSNYGIGKDGRIGLYVPESKAAMTSSNKSNDNRAITIECASDVKSPYAVNNAVYDSIIKLCVDICRRNGIEELRWLSDKKYIGQVDKQNMTVHRWFANTDCPGEYLYSHMGDIAYRVNSKLLFDGIIYRVQVGAYKVKGNAENMRDRLKDMNAFIVQDTLNGGIIYRVQIGAYASLQNAQNMRDALKSMGYNAIIKSGK